MSKIFISYRRDDSTAAACAHQLYDQLTGQFGRQNIFFDIDTLMGGVDFVENIESMVAECDSLIAMIGHNWLDARDAQGSRRLDDPKDWVRLEIGTALKRNIPVIPVLVYGASMPQAEDLPRPLRTLVRRQARKLTHEHFSHDLTRLIQDLSAHLPQAVERKVHRPDSETGRNRSEERVARQVTSEQLSSDAPNLPLVILFEPGREPFVQHIGENCTLYRVAVQSAREVRGVSLVVIHSALSNCA